jgi:thiol-disulfide isomerase/thioredoxin
MVNLNRKSILILLIIFSYQLRLVSAQNLYETTLITSKNDKLNKANFENKIVLVNFWFIGCFPCMKEIPELNRLCEEFKDKVVFLAVSRNNSSEQIEYFINKFPFSFIQCIPNKKYIEDLSINLYPSNILYNKQGQIVYRSEGYDEKSIALLKNALEKLIE